MGGKMTNELETINGYLEWLDEETEKSPGAYVRHLQDEANRITVQTVHAQLIELSNDMDVIEGPVTAEEFAVIRRVVANVIGVLEGDHEYIDIRTLGGDSTIVRTA